MILEAINNRNTWTNVGVTYPCCWITVITGGGMEAAKDPNKARINTQIIKCDQWIQISWSFNLNVIFLHPGLEFFSSLMSNSFTLFVIDLTIGLESKSFKKMKKKNTLNLFRLYPNFRYCVYWVARWYFHSHHTLFVINPVGMLTIPIFFRFKSNR